LSQSGDKRRFRAKNGFQVGMNHQKRLIFYKNMVFDVHKSSNYLTNGEIHGIIHLFD